MQIERGYLSSHAVNRSTQFNEQSNVSLGNSFAGVLKRKDSASMPDDLVASQIGIEATIDDETDAEVSAKSWHSSLFAELSKIASMRARCLAAHGLTEESLRGMSSDDRAAIEKDIADSLKRELSDRAGASATSDQPQASYGNDDSRGGQGADAG
ncbi:hypothetical protein [Rhizobium sp. 2MFCol3.1]|uniref:hypothetical protein n=1 Tax=Rhizobium sp. 2MFCol3.1 TaxID=1246459 RepID=UPI00038159C3|nr:hypothetical protein [Rhizobium sp. 2MFCol3.1]